MSHLSIGDSVKSIFKSYYLTNKPPHCPINSNHSISTNFHGEYICVNCAQKIDDLKKFYGIK